MSVWERDPSTGVETPIAGARSIAQIKDLLLELCYPVGSVYMSSQNVSPQTFLGGTWTQVKDRFILAAGDTYVPGATGGSADAIVPYHTHVQNSHNHTQNAHGHTWSCTYTRYSTNGASGHVPLNATGATAVTGIGVNNATATNIAQTATNQYAGTSGNTTDANMPPYKVYYCWERTA